MGVRLAPLPIALSDPLEKCVLHVPTLVWALANVQSWFLMGVEGVEGRWTLPLGDITDSTELKNITTAWSP